MIEPGVKRELALQDGALIASITQDVEPILELAKARQIEGYHGSSDMKLAASIPFVIFEKYLNDNDITMHEFGQSPEHKKRLLNDPSLAYFRIWPGRI